MKPIPPALACTLAFMAWPLDRTLADRAAATGANSITSAPSGVEDGGRSPADSEDEAFPDDHHSSFEATIITGERSRQFDSPARAMTELQRAVSLRRRAGRDQGLPFKATLIVNGDEYEFGDPDDARVALRSLMDAVRRLARVRAGLADLGRLPEADPLDEADEEPNDKDAGSRDRRQRTMLTIRQRVQQALRQEMQQNQGRRPDAARVQQIAEIEAVREVLARAFSPATRHATESVAAPVAADE